MDFSFLRRKDILHIMCQDFLWVANKPVYAVMKTNRPNVSNLMHFTYCCSHNCECLDLYIKVTGSLAFSRTSMTTIIMHSFLNTATLPHGFNDPAIYDHLIGELCNQPWPARISFDIYIVFLQPFLHDCRTKV